MTITELAPTTEIRNEYDDLSGSFAEACRIADEAYRTRQKQAKKPPERLAKSALDAIDWSLKYGTDESLRKFLEGRPEAELIQITKYIAWKKSQ